MAAAPQFTPDLPPEWTPEPPPTSGPRLYPVPDLPPIEPVPEPPPVLPVGASVPILAGLIVLLWPSSTAPPWADELNPVTGRPYKDEAEYHELWSKGPEEVKRRIAEAQLEKANTARAKASEYPETDPLLCMQGCAAASGAAPGQSPQPLTPPTVIPDPATPTKPKGRPPECPNTAVCKFRAQPETPADPNQTLPDKRQEYLDQNETLDPKTQAPQIKGNRGEVRAMDHNSRDQGDGKGKLDSAADVGRGWHCETCGFTYEIDHILRDRSGKITGIAEVKSGSNLRSGQGAIHEVLAQQNGLMYYKKVQTKEAIKKCERNKLPYIDMSKTPAP